MAIGGTWDNSTHYVWSSTTPGTITTIGSGANTLSYTTTSRCGAEGHVIRDIVAGATSVAEATCENCGERVYLMTLSFAPFLERLKRLMAQVVASLGGDDASMEFLVEVGVEIAAELNKAESVIDEMHSLKELSLALIQRLTDITPRLPDAS